MLFTTIDLTREIFGNIPHWSKIFFYVLAALAVFAFVYGVYRRARLWRIGRPIKGHFSVRQFAARLVQNVLLPRRIPGRGLANVGHLLLFSGFVVLFIATILIGIEHWLASLLGRAPTDPLFHKGIYYVIYEIVTDLFGIALLVGCAVLAWRRARQSGSIGHHPMDWIILALLAVIGVTGYLVEGLRIVHQQTPVAQVSFVGFGIARLFSSSGLSASTAAGIHLGLWWFHAILALSFVAVFPFTRLFHSIAGAINLAISAEPMGVMALTTIEDFEEAGKVGVESVSDFTTNQLMQLDACVSCGRCQDACPAFEAGKPLSPRDFVQDIRALFNESGGHQSPIGDTNGEAKQSSRGLHGDTINAETLWSCTTCSACIDVCPLGVRPLDMITDMRRFLIAEGQLSGPPATALEKTGRSGNPWGLPADDRFDWAKGHDVPTTKTNPGFEVLYWVGCAAAYDPRVRKVALSVVKLLKKANVNFAVLGNEERCNGESARRLGDEFLFQELAGKNIETFRQYDVRKIVTHCPHCLNSFKNDYSQLGGEYDVVHHSQFLAELVEQGRLPISKDQLASDGKVTFHDPCYLARANKVTEQPRKLIQLTVANDAGSEMVEMARNRRDTACCGAGGGRMWFDDPQAERIGGGRVQEAIATGAKTIAVACPFCLVMMTDGVSAESDDIEVRDVAELLADALE